MARVQPRLPIQLYCGQKPLVVCEPASPLPCLHACRRAFESRPSQNYLNGLVSLTSYCYVEMEPPDAVLNLSPNPLSQLINLRSQAESASKQQNMFDKRVGGAWAEWSDIQEGRVKALKLLADAPPSITPAAKRNLLRDAAAISLLCVIPPDRVGVIRKLQVGKTLIKRDDGGWKIDLTAMKHGHKTSRFCTHMPLSFNPLLILPPLSTRTLLPLPLGITDGPYAAKLPDQLNKILNDYTTVLAYEDVDELGPCLFHPPRADTSRCMEPSDWSQWVKRMMKRLVGAEICPKTLRSASPPTPSDPMFSMAHSPLLHAHAGPSSSPGSSRKPALRTFS